MTGRPSPLGRLSGLGPVWRDGHFPAGISAVGIDGDGRAVYGAGNDGTVGRWSFPARGGAVVRKIGEASLRTLDPHPSSGRLLLGGEDGRIRILDSTTLEPVWERRMPDDFINGAAWSPDGRLVAVGGSRGVLTVLDSVTGDVLRAFPLAMPVLHVAWSGNGRWLAASAYDGGIVRWDTGHWSEVRYRIPDQAAWSVRVTDDGTLFSGRDDGQIQWNGGVLGGLPHDGAVSGVVPLGRRYLASLSHDETIRIRSRTGGAVVEELFPVYPGWTACLAADRSGRWLLTTDTAGQSLCVYDVDALVGAAAARCPGTVGDFWRSRRQDGSGTPNGRRARIRRLENAGKLVASPDCRSYRRAPHRLLDAFDVLSSGGRLLHPVTTMEIGTRWDAVAVIKSGRATVCGGRSGEEETVLALPALDAGGPTAGMTVLGRPGGEGESPTLLAATLFSRAWSSTLFDRAVIGRRVYRLRSPDGSQIHIGWNNDGVWIAGDGLFDDGGPTGDASCSSPVDRLAPIPRADASEAGGLGETGPTIEGRADRLRAARTGFMGRQFVAAIAAIALPRTNRDPVPGPAQDLEVRRSAFCAAALDSSLLAQAATEDIAPQVIDAILFERRRHCRIVLGGRDVSTTTKGGDGSADSPDAVILDPSGTGETGRTIARIIAGQGYGVVMIDPTGSSVVPDDARLHILVLDDDPLQDWRDGPVGLCYETLAARHRDGRRQRWLPVRVRARDGSLPALPDLLCSFDGIVLSSDRTVGREDVIRIVAALDHDRARL